MIRTDDGAYGVIGGRWCFWIADIYFNAGLCVCVCVQCEKREGKSGNKLSVSISTTRIVIHNATTAYTYNSVIKLLK